MGTRSTSGVEHLCQNLVPPYCLVSSREDCLRPRGEGKPFPWPFNISRAPDRVFLLVLLGLLNPESFISQHPDYFLNSTCYSKLYLFIILIFLLSVSHSRI